MSNNNSNTGNTDNDFVANNQSGFIVERSTPVGLSDVKDGNVKPNSSSRRFLQALGKSFSEGIDTALNSYAMFTSFLAGSATAIVGIPLFAEGRPDSQLYAGCILAGALVTEALIATSTTVSSFGKNYKDILAQEQCPYRAAKGLKPNENRRRL